MSQPSRYAAASAILSQESAALLSTLQGWQEDMAELRRDIHANPELGYAEHRTSALIAKALQDWGLPVERGIGGTGVVGIVRGGGKSEAASAGAIGLRADMDALPMTEINTFAHASRHPGRMHACGHDGHVAMLLTAARHFAQHFAGNPQFAGTLYLVFQPAEEGGGGARRMLEDGLLERFPMQAMFAMHNWPGIGVGRFALKPGAMLASSNEFKITVTGRGAHAAMPHLGIDPVLVATHIVQALQSIVSRNRAPQEAAVVSVTMIHAGEASNVIADTATLEGTVRTYTTEMLDLCERRLREIATHVAQAFGARSEVVFTRNYPPTLNHVRETAFCREALASLVGDANVEEFVPTMGAEDFAYFLQARPGCYFAIGNGDGAHRSGGHGAGPCTLHNPSYDFNDALLPLGAAAWVRIAERWFAARA